MPAEGLARAQEGLPRAPAGDAVRSRRQESGPIIGLIEVTKDRLSIPCIRILSPFPLLLLGVIYHIVNIILKKVFPLLLLLSFTYHIQDRRRRRRRRSSRAGYCLEKWKDDQKSSLFPSLLGTESLHRRTGNMDMKKVSPPKKEKEEKKQQISFSLPQFFPFSSIRS